MAYRRLTPIISHIHSSQRQQHELTVALTGQGGEQDPEE
jgi:hypothetical protein